MKKAIYTLFQKNVWTLFVEPGEIVEVRILGVSGKSQAWRGLSKGIVAGYFDTHQAFCKALSLADKAAHNGIYFTLQVIDPRLIARAFNHLKSNISSTSDHNVLTYRWLPIDIDPVRPSGISSSDTELRRALVLRDNIASEITGEMGLPAPIRAVSGNGGHLLYRLPDLPVSDDSQLFIKNTLAGLADRFDSDTVKIDTVVYNPARIWKLYGTTSKKGDEVPAGKHREARPHRISYIDDLGDCL